VNLKVPQKGRCKPLVYKNSAMLRVIDKFDDIESAVACFEQVRLSAPSHFPDQASSLK
jgi:hypothetical protein